MSFLGEIKRRKVFQVAVVYAVVAWLLVQIVTAVKEPLFLPDWADTLVIILLGIGFPVALILSWAFDVTPQGIRGADAAPVASVERSSHWIGHVSQVLVLLAVGFLVADQFWHEDLLRSTSDGGSGRVGVQRLSMVLPAEAPITFGCYPCRSLAISPDGATVVYVASGVNDPIALRHLQMRTLDSLTTRSLPGTEGAAQPFFSPDGEWVGFFTVGAMKKVPLSGGGAVTILEDEGISVFGNFAVWLENDTIVYTLLDPPGERQVSAETGAVVDDFIGVEMPSDFVPDQDTLLVTALDEQRPGARAIQAVRLPTHDRTTIVENAMLPFDLGDDLFFLRDDVMHIAPFDSVRLRTGSAVPLVDAVRHDGIAGGGPVPQVVASRDGTIAYVPEIDPRTEVSIVSRDGSRVERPDLPADLYKTISLRRDGRYAAFEVGLAAGLNKSRVVIYDFERGTLRPLTRDTSDTNPSWLPGGDTIALTSTGREQSGLYSRALNGSETLLVPAVGEPAAASVHSASFRVQGDVLAYTVQRNAAMDIWTVDTAGESEPEALIASPVAEHSPQFSPDGRLLAYVLGVGGQEQIYLREYPDGDDIVVSRGFATGPRWSEDGGELFFQGLYDGELMMLGVTVTEADGDIIVGQPQALFPLRFVGETGETESYLISQNLGVRYDVLPDGRFVMLRGPDLTRQREIVIVQNLVD